jgi:hypothetical protein
MDIERIIQENIKTISVYKRYNSVKLRGNIHYHNYIDLKWVFYIKSCVLITKSGNINFENIKMLLLSTNYRVPNGYKSIVGQNGDTPFILSPEFGINSDYDHPESFAFGEYTFSDTRRRKYKVKIKKLILVKKTEIYNLDDVILDLHYQ